MTWPWNRNKKTPTLSSYKILFLLLIFTYLVSRAEERNYFEKLLFHVLQLILGLLQCFLEWFCLAHFICDEGWVTGKITKRRKEFTEICISPYNFFNAKHLPFSELDISFYGLSHGVPKKVSVVSLWSQEPRSSFRPWLACIFSTVEVWSAMLVHAYISFPTALAIHLWRFNLTNTNKSGIWRFDEVALNLLCSID